MKTFLNFKNKDELKTEHLTRGKYLHERFLRFNEQKDWQGFLNRQWVASCIDYLDEEFFEDSETLRWKLIGETINKIGVEIEYQFSILENIHKLDAGDLHGWEYSGIAYGWYETVFEGSQERFAECVRTMRRLLPVATIVGGEDNTLRIMRAKDYPIENLIHFNSAGFANCIWHNEKTPSMKFSKKHNRVHCFGCGKHGDSVDVAQVIYGCTFLEAINRLS